MGDLTPLWRVHAVLGGAEALRVSDPRGKPGIALPHGFGTARWLSGGASTAEGWPLRVETILNEVAPHHVVLNLARADMPDIALVDELHPQYSDGFQRAWRVIEDVRGRLSDLGIRSQPGALIVYPSSILPPAALRKMSIVSHRLGLEPIIAGLDPFGLPAIPPRSALEAGKIAERVADMIAQMGDPQVKEPRIVRAKAGSSGSLAPIE